MESSYRITRKIGPFFFARWNPEVAHLRGCFIGKIVKSQRNFLILFDWSEKVDMNKVD